MGKHFQNKFKPYFPSTQINNIVTQKKSVPSIYFPLEKSPQETLAQRLRSRGRIELPNFPVSPRLSRALYTHPKCPENGSDCFQCGAMTAYFTRGNNVSPSYIYTRIYLCFNALCRRAQDRSRKLRRCDRYRTWRPSFLTARAPLKLSNLSFTRSFFSVSV